jgi:chromosome segregation ATPase
MELNNQRIEKQVNLEIQNIKAKFEEKLKEYSMYPILLEQEQQKLKVAEEKITSLTQEITTLTEENGNLQKTLQTIHECCHQELENKDKAHKEEVLMLQAANREFEEENTELQKCFCRIQKELDEQRSETARIITNTNERTGAIRAQYQQAIDEIERELIQSRAAANITICDREKSLREMQEKVTCLVSNFENSQLQIKALRNELFYITGHKNVQPCSDGK